jgi:hypothetical protein
MSIARQERGSAGLVHTSEVDALLGEAAHSGPRKSLSAGQRLAPLRELIDDRLLDALLERSRDEAVGLRLTGEGSMLGELVKAAETVSRITDAVLEEVKAWQSRRTPHRRTTRHGLARSTRRTPDRLPRTNQVKAETSPKTKRSLHT